MSASPFDSVAEALARWGVTPSVLHLRHVPAYEVSFDALQILVQEKLPAPDLAVLGLLDALGVASVDDVRTYLGLGFEVSGALVQYLLKEGLVREQGTEGAAPVDSLWSRVRTLLGLETPVPPAARRPTQARRVEPVDPSAVAVHLELTEKGRDVLGVGVHPRVVERPCRMVLWADPPHFVRVLKEGRQRFAHREQTPALPPEAVPDVLRRMDEWLALPADERRAALGLGDQLENMDGRILGVVPNRQWEVRPAAKERTSLLVVAGFESSDLGGWVWRSFVGRDSQLELCARLEPEALGVSLEPASLQEKVGQRVSGTPAVPARDRGALRVRCRGEELLELMGEADQPRDRWVVLGPADGQGWRSALLVRGLPASEEDAHLALVELLSRHTASVQRDLRSTVEQVWALLENYWGEPGVLRPPSESWLLEQLWRRPGMRKAVCAARLREDLVMPYRNTRLPEVA